VTRGLADTSIFIAAETGRTLDVERLPDEVAVSIITIGELRSGVLAATDVNVRDRRLSTLMRAMELQPIPIDEPVADAWARLRILLRDRGLRMPVNDSWIAATALALGVPIVTQDDDYLDLPGLDVIRI
jgi:predicted nucleic acid-binding protein